MQKLKIKKEFLATRCEICHKRDFYEPTFNFCSRCSQSLKEVAFDAIENMPSEEALYDWQIITLKDVQIIWLKLSANFLGVVALLYLTPAISKVILSIPPNMFGLVGIGASEIVFIFAILLAICGTEKLSETTQKIINFIKSIFL